MIGCSNQDVAGRMMFEAGGMELGEELEERVKLWQQSIQPHLEAQDRQPVFDIRLYGERIVETMQQEVIRFPYIQRQRERGLDWEGEGGRLWDRKLGMSSSL